MRKSASVAPEIAPSRYIEKVSLATGEVLQVEILPRQLLVQSHRDYHLSDIQARRLMSRIIRRTGDEEAARARVKEIHQLGYRAADWISKIFGADRDKVARTLFGLKEAEYYFRFKPHPYSKEEIDAKVEALKVKARAQLARATEEGRLALKVLLTGGTGFVGKEILWQAAHDPEIREMVVLIRPKTIRDRKSGEVVKVLSPADRGQELLSQLWLDGSALGEKFRFIAGDVEEPGLGIAQGELERLRASLTHVIHCAASVAFDDPYDESYRANVTGTLNALEFSWGLQQVEGSPFVAHLAIETSYIHGRQRKALAREDEIVFPRNFYNNYYELTKAMASIETEHFLFDHGLRVVQLCPAIVIGESRAGNNRGDTKVVNAPVNVFGRAHEVLQTPKGTWVERSSGALLARMACIFPGDPTAELNLIPVDWVAAGIIAALKRYQAAGERVHLATDNRITSEQIRQIVHEELGVEVHLADPTLHRNVTLPVLTKALTRFGQERLASALDKLGTIFGGYSEWGQPVHEVGNDVRVLGLPLPRPNTQHAFRMLCRHNRYVQHFGQVKDLDEISRREKVWWDFIQDLEQQTGQPAGALSADEFRTALEEGLDLERFERKERG
ncbi:MAG TPA: SDR family oxidoreductase [Thermoanaerobaculia bacterium]|nr:SDR family oxidoreductase [Thermoanaerobaculia bacterium]